MSKITVKVKKYAPRIAGYGKQGLKRGVGFVSSNVPKKYRGVNVRKRLMKHEKVEMSLRRKGVPYRVAHRIANQSENKHLTKKNVAKVQGYLGSLQRKLKRMRYR